MKAIAINGSPRKNGSTSVLLQEALRGAAEHGMETKFINLYDLDFRGCRSCFACKVRGGKNYGRCGFKDGLTPLLHEILDEADVLLLGSPIYWWDVSAELRVVIERLYYPLLNYGKEVEGMSLQQRSIQTGTIITMGSPADAYDKQRLPILDQMAMLGKNMMKGHYEELVSYDAPIYLHYGKLVDDMIDKEHKQAIRDNHFPLDKQAAYEMGARLAEKAQENQSQQ